MHGETKSRRKAEREIQLLTFQKKPSAKDSASNEPCRRDALPVERITSFSLGTALFSLDRLVFFSLDRFTRNATSATAGMRHHRDI